MNKRQRERDRKIQESERGSRQWTESWRPWTETHPQIKSLTIKVKAGGVEAADRRKQEATTYSAQSVPFHECGNQMCSHGGFDLRPFVNEMIADHMTASQWFATCQGTETGKSARKCLRSIAVQGSITYKPGK
jgi:hypothetical protein